MKLLSRWMLTTILASAPAFSQRVQLTLDASEADAALAILNKESAHLSIRSADWDALFATAPYRRLKAREAAAGGAFTDDAFQAFLSSPKTIAETQELEKTLRVWRQADLTALGERVLAYLPDGARIRAQVYPEIKPARNSFVWGSGDERAIFLYLNPALNAAQFENKVAHESHHIGLDSLDQEQESVLKALSEPQKKAVRWLGGFGEGEAMLAAAGSPDVHPHAQDDDASRARWDGEMARFAENLNAVQQFLLDILDGRLQATDEIEQRAQPFYGDQGAWYTVGYKMASMVEIRFGRRALTDTMIDPRKLLLLYNQAASEQNRQRNAHLALWSPELLAKLVDRQ
jgi:Putative zinc dependent peptidase (DUF5700)